MGFGSIGGGSGSGGGTFPEAPINGLMYGRRDADWQRAVAVDGDSMTGGLDFGMVAAPGGANDLTRHIALHTNGLGFCITSGRLNYNVDNASAHFIRHNNVDMVQVNAAGITMRAGDITLFREPSLNMHATTKQYVDALITGVLVFIGTIDASTGNCNYTVISGITDGPLVDAATALNKYLICEVPGTIPAGLPAAGTVMAVGDWLISDGTDWVHLGVGGGDYVLKTGDTMSGGLHFGSAVGSAQNDLSRHIDLYGGSFGFGITSGRLNYNVGSSSNLHCFLVANVECMTVTNPHVHVTRDGGGIKFFGDGYVFRRSSTGPMVFRQSSDNLQPQIEDNGGTNPRDMLDTKNGMSASYTTLANAVDLNTVVPPTYDRGYYGLSNGYTYTNMPPGLPAGGTEGNRFLMMYAHGWNSAGDVFQVLYDVAKAAPTLWSRYKVDSAGTWSAWTQVGGNLGNYVAKAGDTMTGGLVFNSGIGSSNFDCSKHITLWVSSSGSDYGFNVTGNRLNYVVDLAASNHVFIHNQTDTARVTQWHFETLRDGGGFFCNGGGGLYKKISAGIVLRETTGNQQPQIENNDGTNGRDILDSLNGVLKAGDTMTGGLKFGSVAVSAANDTSRHLTLYGTGTSSDVNNFGLSITGSRLNLVCSSGSSIFFVRGNTDIGYVNSAGMDLRVGSYFTRGGNIYLYKADSVNGNTPSLNFGTSNGNICAQFYGIRKGHNVSVEGTLECWTSNGGWGWRRCFYTRVASPPRLALEADPANPEDVSTKRYADTKLALAGGTLTGLLTLSAAPTNDLHAATKAYVDAAVAPLLARIAELEEKQK